jgi:hypothetical protein
MAPKDKSSFQASAAIYHRVHSRNTKISKSEKRLHESLANAFEHGIKQGKQGDEVKVTINAADLSRIMRECDKEEKEEMKEELELAAWKRRYADYLSMGLTK